MHHSIQPPPHLPLRPRPQPLSRRQLPLTCAAKVHQAQCVVRCAACCDSCDGQLKGPPPYQHTHTHKEMPFPLPALLRCTRRGVLCAALNAAIRVMGSSKAPARNDGLRSPSYSNLDSISCDGGDRQGVGKGRLVGEGGSDAMLAAQSDGLRPGSNLDSISEEGGSAGQELLKRCEVEMLMKSKWTEECAMCEGIKDGRSGQKWGRWRAPGPGDDSV